MRRALAIAAVAAAGVLGAAYFGGGGARSAVDDAPRAAAAPAASGTPRMLELYTAWCPSCASMKPIVDELAARCAGAGIRVDAVDVSREENEATAERFGVRAVPTFLFLDAAGAETARLVGAQTMSDLEVGLRSIAGFTCDAPASAAGKEG
jgi:thiol-disulfide isomerase/thioredoxin